MSTQVRSDSGETDEIARVRAGDRGALTSFIRRHGPRIQGVASRFLRRERDRNAVVQETFKQAFAAIDAWDDAGAIEPRLHQWALESCIRRLELAPPGATVDVDRLFPRFDETGHRITTPSVAEPSPPTPAVVRACIDRLPSPYRTVLLLRDVEGLDAAATGRLIGGLSARDVERLLHAARQAVQAQLGRG